MKTPNLELVEVDESESIAYQKFNDSFRGLDAIVQLAVKSRTVTTPPTDPEQGDRYIVPEGATGEWAPYPRRIAFYTLDGWQFRTPRNGWIATVEDESNALYQFDRIEWDEMQFGGGGSGSSDFDGNIPASGIYNLSFAAAGAYELVLQADTILQVTSATAGKVNRVILIVRQDEAGGWDFRFPAGTYWAGGAEPAVSRAPLTVHVYELSTYDGVAIYARLLAGSVYNLSGVPATYPSSIDPYWPYVSYLLHMDGANGASIFTDEKGNTVDVIASDITPETTTAHKKFGTASAEFFLQSADTFDGLHQNHLSLPQADITDLTDIDFTIEAWVKLKATNTSEFGSVIAWKGDDTTDNVLTFCALGNGLQYTAGPQLLGAINPSHITYNPYLSEGVVSLSTLEFSHVALCRKEGIYYLALNGHVWSNGNVIASADHSQGPLTVGGGTWLGPSGSGPIPRFFSADLYIDEFQITRGVAKYAPPLPLVLDALHPYATYAPPTSAFIGAAAYTPDVKKRIRQVGATWVRSGLAIATPVDDVVVRIQNKGRIIRLNMVCVGGPGDCVVDIFLDAMSTYPSGADSSIFLGSILPEIAAGHKLTMEADDDWTRDLEIDDVLIFRLESSADFRSVEITLDVEDVQ